MASISTYRGKRGDIYRAIQFVGADRKRRSIRFGSLSANDVEAIKRRIDLLEIYRRSGGAPDPDTAAWLGRVGPNVYDKLAAGGLVAVREVGRPKGIMLGAFLENYLGQRQALVAARKLKADTLRIEKVTAECLAQRFGADKPLSGFNSGDAEDFRHFLLTQGGQPVKRCGPELVVKERSPLAESTTRKRCSIASKIFRAAVRRDLLQRNPFDTDAVPKSNIATEKHAYIKAADALEVLEHLPDAQWKLLFGLCRWGGLRIGETRLLTWGDVHWDERRLLVHSPKTARYQGHESRLVPLFPELEELLADRHEEASGGQQHVLSIHQGQEHVLPMLQGRSDASLRKKVQRAIEAAEVTPWPRLWHNLRGTRQNELLEAGFKRMAVCAWMGNSAEVASEHYEKCTDADWQRATAPESAPPSQQSPKTAGVC